MGWGCYLNENPVRLEIDQEKLVKAKFEFELFNAGVGKWKIRKKKSHKDQHLKCTA